MTQLKTSRRLPPTRLNKEPILEVHGLRLVRGGVSILENVSWRVRRGEHWVILGANGSGKTSLLSALTGYLMPTAGRIDLLGERYGRSDWRKLRRRIGLVSSSLRQMMADTEPALEAVVGGRYAEIDLWRKLTVSDRRQAGRILRQIECGGLAERPWMFLSQGERQRILIGRALMADPKLLILDEPCAGLDPVARERFLGWVQRLGSRPGAPTLVLVTHHVEEIMPVFTHALLIRSGEVDAAGSLKEVLTSAGLSRTFETPARLRRTGGRYSLSVKETPGTLIA